MTRISLLLLGAVLASAFYLVRLQYQSRTLYTAMDRAQAAARKLETERETLQVQKRAQAAALRVESMARTKLGMRETTPAITQYVTIKGGVVQVSAPNVTAAAVRSAPVEKKP